MECDVQTRGVEISGEKISARPPMWVVVMHNDDFTPMGLVVDILKSIFGKNQEEAQTLMLRVHELGQAVCGQFSCEIAETKAVQARAVAQEEGYPLLCTIHPTPTQN